MDEDELKNIARALREGAGRELRDEAAADEEEAEKLRRRRLSLADAARGAMHRGDRIAVSIGSAVTLSHPLIAVGDDYVTMNDGERIADVLLESAVMTTTPSREGGRSGRPASPTFRARLAELEQEQAQIEIVTAAGEAVSGRLTTVASDHVVLARADGTRSYVPVVRVGVVFSRIPPRLG